MTLYIRENISEDFVKLIPYMIIKNVKDNCRGSKYRRMNKYLKKNFNTSIENVIECLYKNGFKRSKVRNCYAIRIDNRLQESVSKETLDSLVRLIDYGNTEIVGIHLFDSSIDYISKNILNVYRLYKMKVKEE